MERRPIHVPDAVLGDLRQRLALTRRAAVPGDGYGVSGDYLRELCEYWRTEYDWRAAEAAMNAYDHYRVTVDGVPVHFLRRPGVGPAPRPLILTHGWPWTFWRWSKVLEPLADPGAHGGDPADAFDLIVPSLPGFGFSGPLDRADLNFWTIAELWHTLMTDVMGFERYAAAGCDVGALVTAELGHRYPDELYGIHIGSGQPLTLFNGERGWDVSGGRPIPDDLPGPARDRLIALEHRFAVHLAAHTLAPDTLAHALADSPAGMLAWILERWTSWSDCGGDVERVFPRDDLLTQATIYWVTNSIGTSMRTYANNNRHPWTPAHDRKPVVQAPTGVTLVAHENPPGVPTAERAAWFRATRAEWYRLAEVTVHERGGHFIPWEIPGEWVADLRRTFRSVR
ncbi:epoxide hydrolase family protein [Nocardia asteroides]|uniref:epoxide hydrolase family protein n=1 Tax=Nocardia asteroides TaxID=1824 RepID=UPI001E45A2C0|nr:epoxide hydrolase family protein [Nocardia asteroides]UGT60080.1 epoxide hydrolase [Nocardia asteroides]